MKKGRDRSRRFIMNECNHIYQRSENGFMIFYDREDYLVCFMIMSVVARKYGVKVLGICFMMDHFHLLVESVSCEVMSSFIRDFTSVFVREYNNSIGRKGKLFYKSYGSAPKKGDKRTRSAIVYIGNNPVEKSLCRHAEDYRWNFLRNLIDPFPFSDKISLSVASRCLRRALGVVSSCSRQGAYINYRRLWNILDGLSGNELEYFTDYLISRYCPIKKEDLFKYYEDWEQMIEAMHSTAGSEHDIKESYYAGSDTVYCDMVRYVVECKGMKYARLVTVLPSHQKMQLATELQAHTCATLFNIKRFLHMR